MAFLRSIRLKGFKTFARPTELTFEQGVAVIIGPNGSGKSNITDAVLWALGEQSPTSIRGQSMQDVIFAGSESQRPAAGAEVSLVFDNSCGSFPAGFQEIEISRRLNRDGVGEYRLNGSSCRLLDIQELIGRVGLGREMHSVISQGKVEELLNSTPAGRRALVEEAAGLGAFKKRRERATTKLDRVQANLQRVEDIEREVRAALRPLKAQVTAAARHAELTEELAALQARLALLELQVLAGVLSQDQEEVRRLEAERTETEGALAGLRARRDSEEKRFTRALAEREERAALYHRAQADLDRVRGRAGALGERLSRLDGELARGARVRDMAQAEVVSAGERLESIRAVPGCSAARLARVRAAGETLSTLLEQARPEWDACDETVETLKDRVLDLETQRSRVRQDIEFLKREIQEQAARRERLGAQRDGAARRLGETEAARGLSRTALTAAEAAVRTAAASAARAGEDVSRAQQAADGTEASLSAAREVLEACRARHRVLEALAARREGVPAAALALLGRDSGSTLLVEGLVVRSGYERAAAAALGPLAHAVVVAGRAHAALIEGGTGPLEIIQVGVAEGDEVRPARASGGPLDLWDVVSAPPEVLGVLRRVLPPIAVVDRLEDAPGLCRVTRSGELALGDAHASRRGEPGAEAFLAARAELDGLNREQEGAEAREARALAAREAASAALEDARLVQATIEEETRHARRQVGTLKDELELLERRAREARGQAADATGRLEKAEKQSMSLSGDASAGARRLETLELEVEGLRLHLREARERGEALRTRVGALEEKRGQASLLAARLRERQRAQEEEGVRARAQLEAATARLAVARRRERWLGEVHPRLEELRIVTAALSREFGERLDSMRQELERSKVVTEGYAEQVKDRGRREVELQQNLSARGELLVQLQVAIAHREDRVAELRRDLADLCRKHLSPRTLGQTDVEGDSVESLEEGIQVAERRRERIGPVNPLAEQEYREAEERTAFLAEQRKDLEGSLAELKRVISELEAHIESTFADVFDATRHNFEEMVQVLFPGGKGTLRLVKREAEEAPVAGAEAGGLAGAGIGLEVRPPRKTPRSLMLLSGGEKALAAIAFLFALFLSRPCPFYILDEVEAALDDVNIARFLSLVRRYQEQTQFLIVTHQHRTMEIADSLYGVAMDKDGISRVLSRRLVHSAAERSGVPPEASLL